MMNFQPVISRVKAKLWPPLPLLDLAAEVRELEPGSQFELRPPVSLLNELDRVTTFEGDADFQVERLTTRVQVEGPTVSYRLPDALLADFTIYCGGRHSVLRSGMKRPVIIGSAEKLEEAQLCTTSCAQQYFGHFLREALPLELLAQQRGITPLTFEGRSFLHEAGYRSLVDMTVLKTPFATVENLWITDERALNGGWVSRFETLRSRVRAKVAPSGSSPVFLKRGRLATGRILRNEDQLAEMLISMGFNIIEPEAMSAAEIASALCSARLAVCVEGSAQQHAFFAMPTESTFLSIQPATRFHTIGRVIADRIGIQFAYVVADAVGTDCQLDLSRLRKTLDLLQ